MHFLFHTLVLFFLAPQALAGICSSSSVIPFSGYKITRRHKIRLRAFHSDSFLVLTKCHRGIPLFSRTVHTSSALDEFATPFCERHTEFDFSRGAHNKPRRSLFPSLSSNVSASTSGILAEKLARAIKLKNDKVRGWLGSFKENTTTQLSIMQSGAKKSVVTGKDDGKELRVSGVCLKMARRKRYARSDVVIFIPATFVGALFACPEKDNRDSLKARSSKQADSSEDKHLVSIAKTTQKTARKIPEEGHRKNAEKIPSKESYFSAFAFKNDPAQTSFTGSMVCPLVADDYSSHWLSVQFRPPALVYHVPYLRSPSIWDPRFRSASPSSSLKTPKWDEEVDINESYIYSDADLSRIGDALAASTKYVQKLLATKRRKVSDLLALKVRWFRKFDPRLQLSLFLFSLRKPSAFHHVVKLQRFWDTLFRTGAPSAT